MLEIQEYIENEEENFVIGGAMIYNLLMPHVTKMYVTEIEEEFEKIRNIQANNEFKGE